MAGMRSGNDHTIFFNSLGGAVSISIAVGGIATICAMFVELRSVKARNFAVWGAV